MQTSEETSELFAAIGALQADLPGLTKDKTATVPMKSGGKYTYRYVGLDTIIDHIGPYMAKHGLAVIQEAATVPGSQGVGISTRITHSSGQWLECGPLLLPAGNDAQSYGSATTYGRRYSLSAALGIAADEDDDGAKAKPAPKKKDTEASEGEPDDGYARTGIPRPGSDDSPKKATKGQLSKLATLSNDLGWDDDERHKRAGVESFTDLSMREAANLVAEWTKLTKEPPAAPAATESEASTGEPERRLISGNAGEVEGSVPDETAANASDAGVVPDPVKGGDAEPIGDGEATEEQWAKLIRFLDGDEAKAHKVVQERFGSQTIFASQMRELIADLLREGKP